MWVICYHKVHTKFKGKFYPIAIHSTILWQSIFGFKRTKGESSGSENIKMNVVLKILYEEISVTLIEGKNDKIG